MDHATFIAELKARAKSSSIASGSDLARVTVIPTGEGLTVLDRFILGCGGFPVGRMVELAAEEGAGKTSIGYNFLASAQVNDCNAVFVDGERRINVDRMVEFGIDTESLVVHKPRHIEDMLEFFDAGFPVFAKSGRPTALVIDSIASIATKEEYDNGLLAGEGSKSKQSGTATESAKEKEKVAGRARLLSRAIRVLAEKIEVANVALLVINQLRTNINSGKGFGKKSMSDTFTPGGKALAYYAAIRLSMTTGEKIESRGVRVGKSPLIMAVKNLYAAPRSARVCLNFDSGFDDVRSLCILGKDIGILEEKSQYVKSNADEVVRVMTAANWNQVNAAKLVEAEAASKREKPTKPTKKKATAKV